MLLLRDADGFSGAGTLLGWEMNFLLLRRRKRGWEGQKKSCDPCWMSG